MYRGTYAYNRHNDLRLYKLDDAHLSCVAATGASLYNAGVTAVSVLVLGRDLIKQLLYNIFLGNIGKHLSFGSQSVLLAESDHLLSHSANFFRSGNGSFNLAVF